MTSQRLPRYLPNEPDVSYGGGGRPHVRNIFPTGMRSTESGPGSAGGGSVRTTHSYHQQEESSGGGGLYRKRHEKASSVSGLQSAGAGAAGIRPFTLSGPPPYGHSVYSPDDNSRYPSSSAGAASPAPHRAHSPPPGAAAGGGGVVTRPPRRPHTSGRTVLNSPHASTSAKTDAGGWGGGQPGCHLLDVHGCHTELVVCGHVDLLRRLPLRHAQHRDMLAQYSRQPGNYDGRYSELFQCHSKLLDYGAGYLGLRLYEDITRPELGEFLLSRGWKMIGFGTNKEDSKTYIAEKWTSVCDH